jgi:hypothetical protein
MWKFFAKFVLMMIRRPHNSCYKRLNFAQFQPITKIQNALHLDSRATADLD